MTSIIQKAFTHEICDQVLGNDPYWWKLWIEFAGEDMKRFYGVIGGSKKDDFNRWAMELIMKEDQG